MIKIRRDNEIYDIEGGWFRARWHFSFDEYRDPENDSFGAMRVFNDDRLIPGAIWPLHPHKDIEGLTYVVEGSFGHQDNVGGAYGPLPAGSVQRMTLGSGALHSEQNASKDEPMRFIQIWILPDTPGLKPQVEQPLAQDHDLSVGGDDAGRHLALDERVAERDGLVHGPVVDTAPEDVEREDRTNRLLRVMGPDSNGGVKIHQDTSLYVASLEAGTEVKHEIGGGRGVYAYLIEGAATFDEDDVTTGDAAKVTDQPELRIRGREQSELILVDVPMRFEPVGIWRGRI